MLDARPICYSFAESRRVETFSLICFAVKAELFSVGYIFCIVFEERYSSISFKVVTSSWMSTAIADSKKE